MKIPQGNFHQANYPHVFAGWQKKWGTPPTEAQLQAAHILVAKPGTKHAFACAMFMRPNEGAHDFDQVWHATQLIKHVDGVPQVLHNYRDAVVRAGYFTRPVTAKNHSQLVITDKGSKLLAERLAGNSTGVAAAKAKAEKLEVTRKAAAKAKRDAAKAKAQATRKARKAKALPAAPVAEVSDAPVIDAPVTDTVDAHISE